MRTGKKLLIQLYLLLFLAITLATAGCAEHRRGRIYDPYRSDYHSWNHDEDGYYHRWESEGHYDHRDFHDRTPDEQKRYWQWRHDHDHDKH
jgi:hypothetical protein